MNLSDASEEDEDDDEELDEMGREATEEGEESAFFGGDGVRGRTSTTLRLSADNDAAEVETMLDSSAGRAADEGEERPSSRDAVERGDADLEQGTTSTTFNSVEEELVVEALTPDTEEDILFDEDVPVSVSSTYRARRLVTPVQCFNPIHSNTGVDWSGLVQALLWSESTHTCLIPSLLFHLLSVFCYCT